MSNAAWGRRSLVAALLAIAGLLDPMYGDAVPVAMAQLPGPPGTGLPPPTAGMARVWFLRQYEPGENLGTPMIFVNGAPLGPSQPGTIFYRDLAPGTYTFAVETCGIDTNQAATMQLAAGGQAELEIQSLQSFTPADCPLRSGTFYVRPVAPHFLQLYLPQLAYLGGS